MELTGVQAVQMIRAMVVQEFAIAQFHQCMVQVGLQRNGSKKHNAV